MELKLLGTKIETKRNRPARRVEGADLHALVRKDADGIHQRAVDHNTPLVVEVVSGDARPVELGMHQCAQHGAGIVG